MSIMSNCPPLMPKADDLALKKAAIGKIARLNQLDLFERDNKTALFIP